MVEVFLAEQDADLCFELKTDRVYYPIGSLLARYNLYLHDGTILEQNVGVAPQPPAGSAEIRIKIAGFRNTVIQGRDFESRTVELTYQDQDLIHRTLRQTYYITRTKFLPLANISEVANELALMEGEIEAKDIDLFDAHITLHSRLTPTLFDTMRTAGDSRCLLLKKLYTLTCALQLSHNLEVRMFKKAGGESTSFTRFDGVNFEKLRTNLQQKYDLTLAEAVNFGSGAAPDIPLPTLFQVGVTVDAITGV